MAEETKRNAPGQVRDAIFRVLRHAPDGLTAKRIYQRVTKVNGPTPESSIRSYLRLNTPDMFAKEARGVYRLRTTRNGALEQGGLGSVEFPQKPPFRFGNATLIHDDCFSWLDKREDNSIHAVVTDPPYGLQEYTSIEQRKVEKGQGRGLEAPAILRRAQAIAIAPVHHFDVFAKGATARVLPRLGIAAAS